jgi:threonine dehydrogenase-like Zn-dependent dehydrogenase
MGGKLAIIGYHLGAERTVPMGSWNWLGLQLINAHFRDREAIMRGMRAGMRLVNSGRLEVGRLVSDTVPLERVADAFELANARRDGFVKAVVVP